MASGQDSASSRPGARVRLDTHEGLYSALEQADDIPGLLDLRIGQWLAWPSIKNLIYARFCDELAAVAALPGGAAGRAVRAGRRGTGIPAAYLEFRRAVAALAPANHRARMAWLVNAHPVVGPDGQTRDGIFDDLPTSLAGDAESLWLSPPAGSPALAGDPGRRAYRAATHLANSTGVLHRLRPSVRATASAVGHHLSRLTPRAGRWSWERLALDALSIFEARRVVWQSLFDTAKPTLVLMTDSAYQCAEVAAARASGAEVVEFQHGLFGTRCPEYGWPGRLVATRAHMPVADRFFVFGPLFRDAAVHNGFWQPEQVTVMGSASLERRRRATARRAPTAAPTRLVFFSQAPTRDEALGFWRAFLLQVEQGVIARCALTIKVHPSERSDAPAYEALAALYPALCTVAAAGADPIQLMLDHDLAVGYTSFALIEAVSLGTPAISLAGEQVPGGIFGLCPIPGAAGTIPVVTTPQELATAMADSQLGNMAAERSRAFCDDGLSGAALGALRQLLAASGRTKTVEGSQV